MRIKLLRLLERNAKYTPDELSEILQCDVDEVKKEIEALEKEKIIQGYCTQIDWEKAVPEMCEAIIELKVSPQKNVGFDEVAAKIAKFDEVRSVYLASGGFDLAVIVRAHSMKEIAMFVGERLSAVDTVLSTATHFMLNTYKKDGVLLVEPDKDERVL